MRKHTCGYPIKTTEKGQYQKNRKGIYYDDNPESANYGNLIKNCPFCKKQIENLSLRIKQYEQEIENELKVNYKTTSGDLLKYLRGIK